MKRKSTPTRGRCLLIANTFPPVIGGSSAVYEALARYSVGASKDESGIVVLTSKRDHRTGAALTDLAALDAAQPYPIHRLDLVRPPLAQAVKGGAVARKRAEVKVASNLIRTVPRLARRYGIDVICVADDETVGWLVALAHLLSRKTIIYCHGDDLTGAEDRITARQRWFRQADAIVAASAFARDRLIDAYGLDPNKIELIRNGVDTARFHPQAPSSELIARHGLEGRRVLLSPTRLVPRKGVDRVIEALPAVLSACPDLIYLVVGDGQQRAALEQRASDLNLGNAVRFAGAVPAEIMPAYYALAHAVALPNRAEAGEQDGLPLVFLEANACGKPVIGGQAGGTREVVEDGVNGLIVDGEDSSAIGDAIRRLFSDEGLYAHLHEGALAAAKDADWGSRAAQFLKLCRNMTD